VADGRLFASHFSALDPIKHSGHQTISAALSRLTIFSLFSFSFRFDRIKKEKNKEKQMKFEEICLYK
jgi:hypothetical protein